jgi:hypothetical protein
MGEAPSLITIRPRIGGRFSESRAATRMSSWLQRGSFGNISAFCLFIGYPRSGHSLLGSLLDAHPDAVIAHELDALGYVERGWTRNELFSRILRHDHDFTRGGREWFGYDYNVPGQWQGRFRTLRVIGDKRGALSTERIARSPALLDQLERLVGVPVRLLHVARNPFDNIATMARRTGDSVEVAASRYFALCETVAGIRSRGASVLDVRHEELVADSRSQLSRVLGWLGLDAATDYLDACTAMVFDSPRQTRHGVAWSRELLERVEAGTRAYDFLAGYTLES